MAKLQEQVKEIQALLGNLTEQQVLNANVKGLGIAKTLPDSYCEREIVKSKGGSYFQVCGRNDKDHMERVLRLKQQL